MREIICRGQRIDNKEWVFGYLIEKDVIVGEIIDFDNEYFTTEFWLRVIPETVGQFTGLTDKNGEKIFEGDIIKAEIYKKVKLTEDEEFYGSDGYKRELSNEKWTVEYKERFNQGDGYYCYGTNRRFNTQLTGSKILNCKIEVIGNIHERNEQ